MSHYKIVRMSKGVRYLKDGKFSKDIPEDVKLALENEDEITSKRCLFCNKPATKIRYVEVQVVDLCDDDYLNKRVGQISQLLKDISNEEQEEKQEKVGVLND